MEGLTMKTLSKAMFVVGMAVAAGACVTSEAEDVGAEGTETETSASSFCREVKRYTYQHAGSTYRWDVTTQLWDGKQFVDERRIGGGFYRQYRVAPVWSDCPHLNESVRLTSGSVVLTGPHVCLPDGREEYHGPDYQRLLVPQVPFIVYNCDL
jgi:hypothetical protein